MKIFKNKFLLSTFILILSGMSTKVLGLIIKIIFTRIVDAKTLGLYTLVMPTYSLLLTISTMSMPTVISKLIAEKNNRKILNNALYIILFINFIIIIFMLFASKYIAIYLLNEKDAYPLLIAMSFTLPLASVACILKGYFYGKEKMLPHTISNTIEQIIRLLIVIFILPYLVKISYLYAAIGLILTFVITEAASIIVFLLFMKKEDKIDLLKINYDKQDIKNIFNLSIPLVSGKIISNIAYFLEPIILSSMLIINGYSKDYILLEYGYYNAYCISTLLIPSFFISAISLVLIPEISKYNKEKNNKLIKKRMAQAIIYTLILGIIFTLTIYTFRNQILFILYHTNKGANYIKILSPFFILFYFEGILSSYLSAKGYTKSIFKITLISSITKSLMLIILTNLKIGIYCLIYCEIINIILTVSLYIYTIKKHQNDAF